MSKRHLSLFALKNGYSYCRYYYYYYYYYYY